MRLKNEATVGIVVLGGLLLLVAGAFWLSGKPWGEEEKELVAIFRQVGELKEGNPVEFRGVQVGRVSAIELAPGGEGVLVTMLVNSELRLPPQPAVVLAPASLFGDWQAQLISLSQFPDLEFAQTQSPGVLRGAALPDITELTAVGARIAEDMERLSDRVDLAFTEETALDIRRIIENTEDMSEQLAGFVEKQTRTYDNVSRNVLQATQNIAGATQTVERVAGQMEQEIGTIVANARLASENLQELSRQLQTATTGVPALVTQANRTLTNMSEVAQNVNQLIGVLQPQIQEVGPTIVQAREALSTLQRAAARIENGEGSLGRLLEDPALFEETQAAIATLRRLMADVQANPERYIGALQVF